MNIDAADMAAYIVANTKHLAKLSPRKKRQAETEVTRNVSRYLTRVISDHIAVERKNREALKAGNVDAADTPE